MVLADAQNLAIRKLLSKAAYESTLTPGPPLPKSHPAPALVAKLHLECAALYTSARSLAKTPDASARAKHRIAVSFSSSAKRAGDKQGPSVPESPSSAQADEPTEVAPELRHYLADEAALHTALAWKWFGVDAGESGGADQTGVAVGFLQGAKKALEEMKSGTLTGGSGLMGTERWKEMRDRRKDRVGRELESVGTFLKGYKRVNDTVRIVCQLSAPFSLHLLSHVQSHPSCRCLSNRFPQHQICKHQSRLADLQSTSSLIRLQVPLLDPALSHTFNVKRKLSS